MKLSKLLLIAAGLALAGTAQAQSWPQKSVRFIVPFPPGGATDISARLLGQKLTEIWGQTVVIENRGGAGGGVGAAEAARATPDGYTLLFASGSLATNVPLYPKLPFHPVKDFVPIGTVGQSFYVLLVQPSLGVNSVQELITMAKAKPNYIQYASAGQGTITHMAVELFMMNAQIKMQDVPFKGGAPALLAFLGDQMPVIFSPIAECLPHLRAGAKVRPLAVTAARRVPDLPDVPTLAEAGVPDSVVLSRTGILAPAGTRRDIVNLLNTELNRLLQQAYVRDRLNSYGLVPVGGTPEDLGNHLKSEIARWTKVVKAAGIKLE